MRKITDKPAEEFSRKVTEVLSAKQLRKLYSNLMEEDHPFGMTVGKIGTKGYRIVQIHTDEDQYYLDMLRRIKDEIK